VRVIGSNFRVNLSVEDQVITAADRPVSYMRGWPLARVLALAERWQWKVEFNDTERKRGEDQCDRTQRPST
jgi:hypothetical protein